MTYYITRLGQNYIGGADNLSEYLLNKFCKKFSKNVEDIKVGTYEDFLLEMNHSSIDLVFAESSALPRFKELINLPDEIIHKIHCFMHNILLSQENELSEAILGPSVWDIYDTMYFIKLMEKGFHAYYASANHAEITKLVCGGYVDFLDISDFNSKNCTGDPSKHYQKINNSILFTSGYYHPGVGIHILMRMIKLDKNKEFQWYLVGRTFDRNYYRMSDRVHWTEVYKDILNQSNVHVIGFCNDLSEYYEKCEYHLVMSAGDSYSFKALEAYSYNCINVTTRENQLLPWSQGALIANWSRDLDELAHGLFDLINSCSGYEALLLQSSNKSLERVKSSYKDIDRGKILQYTSILMREILDNSKELFDDSNIEDNYWKYNRL